MNEDTDKTLRLLVEGTSRETGEDFFWALVENLAEALGTAGAWVTEYDQASGKLVALAFWLDGKGVEAWESVIPGTPCEAVITEQRLVHYPDQIVRLFPLAAALGEMGAVSYLGVPLKGTDGSILGHLAVLDRKPMPAIERNHDLIRIFAARAAAELLRQRSDRRRHRAEKEVRKREAKLRLLVEGAMDAILELDDDTRIAGINLAGERIFGTKAEIMKGTPFEDHLVQEEKGRMGHLIQELAELPDGRRSLWIPGGFQAVDATGSCFSAEGTLARTGQGGSMRYIMILRNVEDRIRAERRIEDLTRERSYLQEEIRSLSHFDEIVGKSPPLLEVLQDIEHVADTDASVLILGETGTGKELVARAIHAVSTRRERALIRVNCSAIPVHLIESELFGHERGAFTGATERREGRFSLADGGTIFLDEIGEIPLDLQVKMLRVLQEKEFEPLGSSKTRRVDVRILSATHRDLHDMVQQGTFREDLYYRLNVFPILIPPLRDRGQDVALLAADFAERIARRMGKRVVPLTEECQEALLEYHWPGNVRELQNVIERAIITSRGGGLDLERALQPALSRSRVQAERRGPGSVDPHDRRVRTTSSPSAEGSGIYSVEEFAAMERRNILKALQKTNWRISGQNGAAALLGLKASTLSSRIKAIGIQRG